MRPLSLFCLLTFAVAAWGASDTEGTRSADAVGRGEFPGLQLLPPGSVVEDITLPRYEQHRVTALFQAKRLIVDTRRIVKLQGVSGTLYNEDGTTTELSAHAARYNFTTKLAAFSGSLRVINPRFSAQGTKLNFDTENKRGMLLGPVRTTFSASAFSSKGNK